MSVKIGVTIEGFGDAISDLEAFVGDVDAEVRMSLKSSLITIENTMRNNVATMFTLDYARPVLIRSISSTAVIDKHGNPAGSVGVYNMSRKTGSDARRPRSGRVPPPAPLVAFWHIGGTQPHSLASGSRAAERPTASKPRGAPPKGQDQGSQHPGFVSTSFMERAWFANAENITTNIVYRLNKVTI